MHTCLMVGLTATPRTAAPTCVQASLRPRPADRLPCHARHVHAHAVEEEVPCTRPACLQAAQGATRHLLLGLAGQQRCRAHLQAVVQAALHVSRSHQWPGSVVDGHQLCTLPHRLRAQGCVSCSSARRVVRQISTGTR